MGKERESEREGEGERECERETSEEDEAAKWPVGVSLAIMAGRDREKSGKSEGEGERRGLRPCVHALYETLFFHLRVKYPFHPLFSKRKVPFALLRKLVFTFSLP